MKTIYKYPLDVALAQTVPIHPEAKILTIQTQNGIPTIWAEKDEDGPEGNIVILCRGTGHELTGEEGEYIGTVQTGPYVWHYYRG